MSPGSIDGTPCTVITDGHTLRAVPIDQLASANNIALEELREAARYRARCHYALRLALAAADWAIGLLDLLLERRRRATIPSLPCILTDERG